MAKIAELNNEKNVPSDDDIAAVCKSLGWDLDAQAQPLLYQHDDGRYGLSSGPASFAVGDPAWHRVPIDVIDAGQPSAQGLDLTHAARDVLAERQRQISAEGWTPEHDDAYADGALAMAAANYAHYLAADRTQNGIPPLYWPWHSAWWKPSDRRRNLEKAGALILAEIERLDRAAARAAKGADHA